MTIAASTIAERPQIHLNRSTSSRMWLVSACALLGVLQSSLGDSFRSLITAAAAVAAAVLAELAVNAASSKYTLKDGSTVASALIFSLLLPNTLHPAIAAMGAAFAVVVVKHSFGGLGANWLNPALGAWFFVRLSWPDAFAQALDGSLLSVLHGAVNKGLSDPSGSPLALLKIAGYKGGAVDGLLTSLLNGSFFSYLDVEFPGGYLDLFSAPGPGIIADRGLFGLTIGTILVGAAGINRTYVPAVYLAVLAVLVRIYGARPFGGELGGGDMLFAFLSGGTMAAAFFLIADPATQAKSRIGCISAAAAAAALTVLLRYLGYEAYGAFHAVALVNALNPALRGFESRVLYKVGRST